MAAPPASRALRRTFALLLCLAAACSGEPEAVPTPSPSATEPSPSPSPSAGPSPSRSASVKPAPATASPTGIPALRLRRVASLNQPLAMATRPNDGALYIAEKGGRVVRVGGGSTSTVLDLRGRVATGSEQGLLGLDFDPDGTHLYVNYTDTSGDTRLVEYRFSSGRAVASSRRQLLRVDQPYANHNGGMVAFGGDGLLYTSLGDGGSGGDPQNNAQSLGTLLGKIIRIDPRPSGSRPYRIPPGNPFVGRTGRDEIWSYGLRNPWRFTFDRSTDDMWIGDVGQGSWEEIDFEPASASGGRNYGWDRLEGRHRYEGSPPRRHVLPVYEYALSGSNCAVTGGYVYRGPRMPGLRGWYLFADFCTARVMRLKRVDGDWRVRDTGLRGSSISSFGEGAGGELYVLSLGGSVWKIVPA